MKSVLLTQNKFTIIDDEDYKLISDYKWCVSEKRNNTFYAVTNTKDRKRLYLHRLIMEANKGDEIDHINHDTLDNRRSNLRITNPQQQQWNRTKGHFPCSSEYKGVHWFKWGKRHKRWKAVITVTRKTIFLGYFLHEIEAAREYDKAAIEYFGEYAYINGV